MKYIPLTQGKKALIDDDDFKIVSEYQWQYDHGYARGWVNRKRVYMHRMLLKASRIDHINGNTIDNRKSNLRPATQKENTFNHSRNKNNTSGFKGVSWHKSTNKWRAYISPNNKMKSLGLYSNKEDAARAYNEAAKEYFGEFAKLNNI